LDHQRKMSRISHFKKSGRFETMCKVYWIVKTVHICEPYIDHLSCCFIDRWIYDSVMVVLIGGGKSLVHGRGLQDRSRSRNLVA